MKNFKGTETIYTVKVKTLGSAFDVHEVLKVIYETLDDD